MTDRARYEDNVATFAAIGFAVGFLLGGIFMYTLCPEGDVDPAEIVHDVSESPQYIDHVNSHD